jgi:hypothetical protein
MRGLIRPHARMRWTFPFLALLLLPCIGSALRGQPSRSTPHVTEPIRREPVDRRREPIHPEERNLREGIPPGHPLEESRPKFESPPSKEWVPTLVHGEVPRVLCRLPTASQPLSKTLPLKVKGVVITPKTEVAFKNVFKRSGTAAEFQDMQKHEELFRGQGATSLSRETDGLPELKKVFQSAKENKVTLIILVGHSVKENGVKESGKRYLVLPDGYRVSKEEVQHCSAEFGIQSRVLTCHGEDFDLRGDITLAEASEMYRFGMECVPRENEDRKESPFDTQKQIDELTFRMDAKRYELKARRVVISGTGFDTGGWTVWEARRLPRPDRTLPIILLFMFGVAQLFYCMWVIRPPKGKEVRTPEELTTRMAARRKQIKRLGLLLGVGIATSVAWLLALKDNQIAAEDALGFDGPGFELWPNTILSSLGPSLSMLSCLIWLNRS